ncbi:uncharacterized protein CTRU02_206696 [Colletotrichum truncatum]|uniref:Uncharacterized protein n=1 Tax=Colletotrichum truncatum TaxID=5467 RepID=A0ACC3Z7M5_COLTU|nr:Nitrogen assimilation transcription factor nirA 5 [Colletotrichum truncatum]KAF6782992.1 Nitrogen assimilation transcription factor nirA 5 [Colletotrichum truncatum]
MDSKRGDDANDTATSSQASSLPNNLRTLLPAPTATSPPVISEPEQPPKPPRQPVPAACLQCRKRKVKCTGTRPTCSRCSIQGLDCKWDTEPDTTRSESLRRRNEELERENEDLHEILRFLTHRPKEEALEILNRLRSTGDVFRVLELVRVGDLLLGKHSKDT